MTALIPYQKIEIKTRLGQEAALQKLNAIVEPRKLRWRFSRDHLPFEGTIEGVEFKISRIIHYRNSFLPILDGKIRDDLDVSTLEFTARPFFIVMLLWPMMGIIFVASILFSGELSFLWIILPLFLIFYGVPTAFFNWELNKTKKLLEDQFAKDGFMDSF